MLAGKIHFNCSGQAFELGRFEVANTDDGLILPRFAPDKISPIVPFGKQYLRGLRSEPACISYRVVIKRAHRQYV